MPPSTVSLLVILLLATLVLGGCIAVWTIAIGRWRHRQPVIPYQPRRPVPWRGIDLMLIVAVYLLAQSAVLALARLALGPAALRAPAIYDPSKSGTEHDIIRLMGHSGGWVILLCVVSVVLIAPLVEEFLFRLLFQGWLEAIEQRLRKQMPTLRRLLPRASLPIFLSALLFARMHFRVNGPPINPRLLAFTLAGSMVAGLFTVAFAVGLLRWRVGATAADLGYEPKTLPRDAATGLLAFLAAAAPVYFLQSLLSYVLPKYLAPDPFTLFFFALVLGVLYFRTHRIAPSIVAHAALNATSVLLWFL